MEWFGELAQTALEAVSGGSPAVLIALLLVAAFTEVGVPFPFIIDTALFLTSYRTETEHLSFWVMLLLMLALFLGRVVGASIIYWLARLLGFYFIRWLGKHFPALCERLNRLSARLSRRVPVTVAVARLTPGLLTGASIAAGAVGVSYFYFILGIGISSVIADAGLLALGVLAGLGFTYLGFTPHPLVVVLGLVALIILIGLARRFLGRKHPKAPSPPTGPTICDR